MKVYMRDEETLVIEPENTAELSLLRQFKIGVIELEKPKPFEANVEILTIKMPEEKQAKA